MESSEFNSNSGDVGNQESDKKSFGKPIFMKIATQLVKGSVEWTDISDYVSNLVRGLASHDERLTQSFYAALVAALNAIPLPPLSVEMFSELVDKELPLKKGKAKNDGVLVAARILAYGSLIHSKCLLQLSNEDKVNVFQKMINLGTANTNLNGIMYSFITMFLNKENESVCLEVLDNTLKEKLMENRQNLTIDELHILVFLRNKFRCRQTKKLLKDVLGAPEPICEATGRTIVKILMTPSTEKVQEHPFYSMFSEILFGQPDIFPTIWSYLDMELDETSPIKETILIILFKNFMKIIDSTKSYDMVPVLLTSNLVRLCLLKQKKKQPTEGRSVYLDLCNVVNKANVDVKLSVLSTLLFYPGDLTFDNTTGSKVISTIIFHLPQSGVKHMAEICYEILSNKREKIDHSKESIPWTDKDKILAAYYLSRLLNHKECHEDVDWRLKQLSVILDLAFFSSPQKLSIEVSRILGENFFGGICHKFPKFPDYVVVMTSLVNYLDQRLGEMDNNCVMKTKYTDQVADLWKRVKYITADSEHESLLTPVFKLLVCHMGLMLFKDPRTAKSALSELFTVLNKLPGDQNYSEPNWPEIIDLLLHLLSKNLYPYRYIVKCVFKYFAPHITQHVLQQILSVFHVDQGTDEDTNSMEESDSEEEGADQEGVDDDDDGDEDEDEDEDEEEDEVVLGNIMKTSALDSADEEGSIDLDNLTAEEGKMLNAALSQAFLMRSATGTQLKDNKKKEEYLHFRLRVLDLLDVLIDAKPSLSKILECIRCLFELLLHLIKSKKDDALQIRLRGWMRKVTAIKDVPFNKGVDEEAVTKVLETVLKNEKQMTHQVFIELQNEIISFAKLLLRTHMYLLDHSRKYRSPTEEFTHLFQSSMLKNDSKRNLLLSFQLTKVAIDIGWEGVIKVMPNIMKLCFHGNRMQQMKNIELLLLFCKNNRAYNAESMLKFPKLNKKISKYLLKGLDKIFKAIILGKCKFPKNYYIMLWDILQTLHQGNCIAVDWEKMKEMLENFFPHLDTINKNIKLTTLCKSLNIEPSIISQEFKEGKVRENGSENNDSQTQNHDQISLSKTPNWEGGKLLSSASQSNISEESSKLETFGVDEQESKRKRGRKTNVLKLKKESKIRRLESMSGLEKNVFSASLLQNIDVFEQ